MLQYSTVERQATCGVALALISELGWRQPLGVLT